MDRNHLSPSDFIGVQGKGIISFGSGQPDLPPPELVYRILPTYRDFRYGTVQGMPKLREALAREYPRSEAGNFVITNGASEALDLALRAIGNKPGKKKSLLLPRPYYYSYPPLARYAGMKPVYTQLVNGRIDFDDFEEKAHQCRAMLINSPSNPTGRVEAIPTLRKIEKIASDLGIYVISDEVYKDLIYVRENYLIQGPHVVTINSFSKTYAMCGLRVGYLWSLDREMVNDIIGMKSHTSMNTNILGQEMAYEATKVPKSLVNSQIKIWRERRDIIYDGLSALGLELWKPEGAFYVLPKVRRPRDFVWNMHKKYKVITYLGEWFGAPERVRFSYALDKEKIEEGLKRVKKYLESG